MLPENVDIAVYKEIFIDYYRNCNVFSPCLVLVNAPFSQYRWG